LIQPADPEVINEGGQAKWHQTLEPPRWRTSGRKESKSFGRLASVENDDSRLTFEYASGVRVYYENRVTGLKQGMILPKPPQGQRTFDVFMNVETNTQPEQIKDKVLFQFDGKAVLEWKGLLVIDAEGKRVPAKLVMREGMLQYRIDSTDATYPIEVDPLSQNPLTTIDGDQAGASFGDKVSNAGDVNGDGFADLLVGQPRYESSVPKQGRVLVYHGSSSGILNTAAWTTLGEQDTELYGLAIDSLGDVDGDGFDDIVAAGYAWDSASLSNVGRVRMFTGSASGLGTTATWTYTGSTENEFAGRSVALAGDVNCDGRADLVIGSAGRNSFSGGVDVFYGQSTSPFLSNTPDWSYTAGNGANLGFSVSGQGNLNDDTDSGSGLECDDITAGAPFYDTSSNNNRGRVLAFYGSASGPASTPDWTAVGTRNQARFGFALSSTSDLDQDGIEDIAVGAPEDQDTLNNEGSVTLFAGTSSGVSTTSFWKAYGNNAGAEFGRSLSTSIDSNDDGNSDLLVGAPFYSTASTAQEGKAFLFLGASSATSGVTSNALWTAVSTQSNARFGWDVDGLEDVNGDGIDDAVISAFLYSTTSISDAGRVNVYEGQTTCLIGGTAYASGESNPNNPCEVCDPSVSTTSFTSVADGTSCDDGDACTINDQCQAGTCSGVAKDCDDGLACTADSCSAGTCQNDLTSGCLINGTCIADGLANPNNQCEVCDPSASTTSYSPAGTSQSCEDGLFCTVNDSCDGSGNCVAGDPRDCSAALTQCFRSTFCDESRRTCDAIDPRPSGTLCDDGNACTESDECNGSGRCVGTQKDCSNLDGPCTLGTCDSVTGNCVADEKADGTTCDDGDACTDPDTCQSGSCTSGATVDCDDGNECTAESCDSVNGCQYTDVAAGTTCGAAAACQDGTTLAPGSECDGSGTCSALPTVDCSPYLCDSGACTSTCTDDDDCAGDAYCDVNDECSTANRAPVADAGMDQTVDAEVSVTLDGSQSSDPDGDDITYLWEQQSGESVTLDDDTAASPSFTAPRTEDNELVFQLTVEDEDGLTATDTTTVTIDPDTVNEKPVAVISGPDEAEQGASIELDGTDSSDPDGDPIESYSWSLDSGDSDFVTLTGTDADTLTVEFSPTATVGDEYVFQLIVSDEFENSDPTTHTVTVTEGDVDPDTGGDDGDDVGPDAGQDAGSDIGVDTGSDIGEQPPTGELGGSGCACNATGDDRTPDWLAVVFALGGLALLRRRRD
jgi:MYXO-CTERM domain-containing protein